MAFSARESARELLSQAVSKLAADGVIAVAPSAPAVSIESPKRPEHGDFSSNVAMTLAKGAGKPPRAIADAIVARLEIGGSAPLSEATIAGPGFINLRFSNTFWQDTLKPILAPLTGARVVPSSSWAVTGCDPPAGPESLRGESDSGNDLMSPPAKI